MLLTVSRRHDPASSDFGFAIALLAAIVLHAVLLAAFKIDNDDRTAPPAEALTIDLVPPPAKSKGTPVPEKSARSAADPTDQPRPDESGDTPALPTMTRARRLYTASVLEDSRYSEARQLLQETHIEDRLLQLCNTEAMEQIALVRPDLSPDKVVAYARSDVMIAGNSVTAAGAALRSNGIWHDLHFRCDANTAELSVSAFEYALGNPIPSGLWEQLSLPTD
ncbi:DUF930 domain-containing protein [Roseibium sp.]|uniref:DUF930 domain-containing protein n=1 Tax=Roseibium sp. TaxID=1936156 RepID=UPI003A974022